MSERRDIERERDYYRQKFEELGTTLREKQEALEHASSNNRRYQTTAVLTERLAKLTVSPTSKDKLISSFIRTFVETTNIDRAVLFQYQPQQGAFSQLYSLGLKCSQPVSLEAAETPPEFAYADTESPDEGVIAELRRALGVQHLLWAYHSSSKKALLAGNKTEDARFKRPFAEALTLPQKKTRSRTGSKYYRVNPPDDGMQVPRSSEVDTHTHVAGARQVGAGAIG